jgi:hypothetical protein
MTARLAGLWFALACAVTGCQDPAPGGPSVGTNSNWLRACTAETPCSPDLPACTCGACTVLCATDADCDELWDARCALAQDQAAAAACGSGASSLASGICLPRCAPGSCEPDQACVAEACVLAPLPDVPLCAALGSREAAARAREEELLSRLQALRLAGGARCGDAGVAPPAPALRFDTRLTCAARVLAVDVAEGRSRPPADAAGRTIDQRMREAGYAPRLWAEAYALEARSAQHALELMLSHAESCTRLSGAEFADVGVGSADNVLVVTLGVE